MRIAFVISGLGVGGAEAVVCTLADSLASKGHTVKIFYMRGEALVTPSNPNVELIGLGFNSLLSMLPSVLRYVFEIYKFKPDLIHSHMFHANILARVCGAPLFSSAPVICTAHSNNEGGKLRMLSYRITHFRCAAFTSVSAQAAKEYEYKKAAPQNSILVVSNPIDASKFFLDENLRKEMRQVLDAGTSKVVLAVGRLVEAKDYFTMIKAFKDVISAQPETRLYIAGDGPLMAEIKNYATELDLNDYVFFLGKRRDIPALMNAADVFVLSSAWEGFGLVVAEAMATEKIVVATDCGGVKEVMGSVGYLVPKKDPSSLSDALLVALSLPPESAKKLGEKARELVVEKYSVERIVSCWLKIYSDVSARL